MAGPSPSAPLSATIRQGVRVVTGERRERMAANGLAPRVPGGAADVVRAVCGIQAQDSAAAALSVRARSEGLTAAEVAADAGTVRTWAWRGTLHLLAREDLGWVLSLVAPVAIRAVGARWRGLGLDEDVAARARAVFAEALAGGPRTRAAMRAALEGAGVDASGQRLPHLLRRAALEGELTCGVAGDEYHALEGVERPAEDDALAELGRRYAAAYGPSEPADLAAWSGLPRALAARAHVAAPRREVVAGPVVRLLPAFDTYLLGYRSREHAVPAEHAARVRPGGGWIHPVVLVDGVAAGTWKLGGGKVAVDAWAEIPPGPLEAEIADVARFRRRER
jgi:hypothetical protein